MFSWFTHGLIRKYIIVFGSLFDDITVQRYDNSGNHVQTLPVPLAYGPKQKFLVRLEDDPNFDKKVAISLPRMGFEIQGIAYDTVRKLNTVTKNIKTSSSDPTVLKTQYTPVPYNIEVQLSIFVKNADDGTQIIEQILPYFRPEWGTTVNVIPEMDLSMDVPIILNSISFEDTYEGDFDTRRALIYNLNFSMKAYIYGPVANQGVIKRTRIDFHANTAPLTPRSSRIVLVPSLLANGSPTTNSASSISRHLIEATDDYGFASNTFFFTDGFRYNPITGSDE